MDTVVTYHDDGEGPHPAINVKDHHSGMDFVIALEKLVGDAAVALGASVNAIYPDELRNIAAARVSSDFWQAAQEMATQRGMGEIAQEGRSGGWLVFTQYDPYVNEDDDATTVRRDEVERSLWMAGYRAMTEWANEYIAAVPAKVAALVQDMAMDEAGHAAARRMFATHRRELTLREYRATEAASFYAV